MMGTATVPQNDSQSSRVMRADYVGAQICINILHMPYLLFTPYHIM